MKKPDPKVPTLDVSLVIRAQPTRVLKGFFDPEALGAWWQTARSLTTPRVLGPYALEWKASESSDEVLGRLGGVFSGTVMQIEAERGFFVAEAYWLPPDGDPIGPMALEVTCSPVGTTGDATRIRVTQSGFEESVRWRRYYEVASVSWERALGALKALLEK